MGLELEFDAGRTTFTKPDTIPSGWSEKCDGSLGNGMEYVLARPIQLRNLYPKVEEFDVAFNAAKTNCSTKGGFHVHVQVADYSHDDALALAKLYTHFQSVINGMVGASRVDNYFCPPYPHTITKSGLVNKFRLDSPTSSRGSAKGGRSYSVINFAMMRCTDPDQRTAEFRQGSPSKRKENIFGWTCFVTALVDVVKSRALWEQSMEIEPTLENLCWTMSQLEPIVQAVNLSSWVSWRWNYLNEKPTPELISRAVQIVSQKPHGIGLFGLSRAMDTNLAVAKRVIEEAARQRLVHKLNHSSGQVRYGAAYDGSADLRLIGQVQGIVDGNVGSIV
jgi:hypothetical protein